MRALAFDRTATRGLSCNCTTADPAAAAGARVGPDDCQPDQPFDLLYVPELHAAARCVPATPVLKASAS